MSKKFAIHCTITPTLNKDISCICMTCSHGVSQWTEYSTNTNHHSYMLYRNKKRFRRRIARYYEEVTSYSTNITTTARLAMVLYNYWTL